MRDFLGFVCFFGILAAAWGVIRPYKGISRKWFAVAAVAFLILGPVIDPPASGGKAEAKKDGQPEAVTSDDQSEIAKKADEAISSSVEYTRADNPKTLKLVGAASFDKLTELEPGAIYAAAESRNCDRVVSGAVSLEKSSKGKPEWFVDCANGNRFMITADQAAAALQRKTGGKLAFSDLAESCTTLSVRMCFASEAQKQAKEAEVVTFCDMTVQQALISDPDMDWSWNYAFADGDEVQVVRGFEAQNAFGAELNHRYFCHFDAKQKRITKLVIEGPMGSQRII